MSKRTNESLPDESVVTDISELGALSSSLREREADSIALFSRAEALLDQSSAETTVDGIAALVTTDYCDQLVLDDKPVYARLGRYVRSADASPDLPSIIFCANKEFDDIRTTNGYFSALTFRGVTVGSVLEGVHLIAGGGVADQELASDRPEHIALTKQIVDTISAKASKRRNAEKTAAEAERQQMERTRTEAEAAARDQKLRQETLRQHRHAELKHKAGEIASTAGSVALVASLVVGVGWYNTWDSLIRGKTIDAPGWPAPIEWIVDIANHKEHEAEGFPKPVGALPIVVGQSPTSIPLITTYDANGVPDASHSEQNDNNDYYNREESNPGLYSSNFDSTYHYSQSSEDNPSAAFGDNGRNCYDIYGDYQNGETSVFTQTVGVNKMIRLSVPDIHTLRVCKAPDASKRFKGSILLYRKP